MGDGISIRFITEGKKSICFFSHYDGKILLSETRKYVEDLLAEQKNEKKGIVSPLDRLEPNTVMVDFMRWFTKDMAAFARVNSNYSFGETPESGYNSENGNYNFVLDAQNRTFKIEKED